MRSVDYHNVSINDLFKIISELSLSMNNQVLEIRNLGNTLIQLRKYQVYNRWGIRILTNSLDEAFKHSFVKFLSEKMISYQVNSEQEKYYSLDIDVKNDLQMTMEIIRLIFSDFYQLRDFLLFSCVYTKRSVLPT